MLSFRDRSQQPPSAFSRALLVVCALGVGCVAGAASPSFAAAGPGEGLPLPPILPPATEPPPGQGPPPPPAQSSPRRLSPFPVVLIAGRERGRTTRVTHLRVSGPTGALVRIRCLGAGCPMRRTGGTIGSRKRVRLRRAERSYRAGTALEIRVLDEDEELVGKYTRVRFRRGQTPRRIDSCLAPGSSRPSPCPRG